MKERRTGLTSRLSKGKLGIRNLVKGLLDYSRPAEGKVEVVNVNSVVRNCIVLVAKRLSIQGIRRRLTLSRRALNVLIDQSQLTQVFYNLLNNAIDAMLQGGDLTVSAVRGDGMAVIKFIDTGTGISPENLSRLFQPFFTTKRDMGGTGLGLSISQSLINRAGGKIEAESQLGKGSIFTVTIPLTSSRKKRSGR